MSLTFLSHHPARPIDWLWPDRIPLGKPTLLLGDPDAGKSFFALALAARITRGDPPPACGFATSTIPNSSSTESILPPACDFAPTTPDSPSTKPAPPDACG